MNRRRFLICGGAGVAFVLGGPWVGCSGSIPIPIYSGLPRSVRALYGQEFMSALPSMSTEDVVAELARRNVYVKGQIRLGRIRVNAADDPLEEFDNFLYTRSELLLYALVARLRPANESA